MGQSLLGEITRQVNAVTLLKSTVTLTVVSY